MPKNKEIKRSLKDFDYHLPVMLRETVEILITDKNGIYIDGTIGGGGHTAAILEKLGTGGKLFGFDKDPLAVKHCKARLKEEIHKGRLRLSGESYEKVCSIEELKGEATGILVDLGVSSRQFDDPSAGFTFREDAPLDMRFNPEGPAAADFLHAATQEEIKTVLKKFGEEPKAGLIARRIVTSRRAAPLISTFRLKALVEECVPPPVRAKTLARVFQALRIHVNKELAALENFLSCIPDLLAPGGRIAALTYHSLEDRIVKQFFKKLSTPQELDPVTHAPLKEPEFKILTKKPLLPSEEEIKENPRARSAKLRAAEKLF